MIGSLRTSLRWAPWFATISALVVCATSAGPQRDVRRDASGHHVSLLPVAADVTLEVLNWGGKGPSLIFLADQNSASWNRVAGWLRQLQLLRSAA